MSPGITPLVQPPQQKTPTCAVLEWAEQDSGDPLDRATCGRLENNGDRRCSPLRARPQDPQIEYLGPGLFAKPRTKTIVGVFPMDRGV